MSLRRWAICFLSIFLLSLVIFAFFPEKILPRMVDFEVNYRAGQRLLWGETLYRTVDGHYQFKYPPFAAFLYLPLSYLPEPTAKFIWFYLTAISIFSILILSAQMVRADRPFSLSIPFFTGLILARFFLRELSLGQINALITCLLLLMIKIWLNKFERGKFSLSAGFLWALASSLKPYALIFLPLFILRLCWPILWSGLFFFFLALLAPALFYGLRGNWLVHQEWLSHLRLSTPPLLTSQDNISFFALIAKWFGPSSSVWLLGLMIIGLLALTMLLAVVYSGKTKSAIILEAAALLLLIPLISPLGWDYTCLSSVLTISLLLRHFSAFPKGDRYLLAFILACIGLMIYDLLGHQLYAFLMKASFLTLLFFSIFIHLLWLRFKKIA